MTMASCVVFDAVEFDTNEDIAGADIVVGIAVEGTEAVRGVITRAVDIPDI